MRSTFCVSIEVAPFWRVFLVVASQKIFLALTKWKPMFLQNKVQNFRTFVFHAKMQVCAEYGKIIIMYAMDMVIVLVIWFETHECSYMIALFMIFFLKWYFRFGIFPANYVT